MLHSDYISRGTKCPLTTLYFDKIKQVPSNLDISFEIVLNADYENTSFDPLLAKFTAQNYSSLQEAMFLQSVIMVKTNSTSKNELYLGLTNENSQIDEGICLVFRSMQKETTGRVMSDPYSADSFQWYVETDPSVHDGNYMFEIGEYDEECISLYFTGDYNNFTEIVDNATKPGQVKYFNHASDVVVNVMFNKENANCSRGADKNGFPVVNIPYRILEYPGPTTAASTATQFTAESTSEYTTVFWSSPITTRASSPASAASRIFTPTSTLAQITSVFTTVSPLSPTASYSVTLHPTTTEPFSLASTTTRAITPSTVSFGFSSNGPSSFILTSSSVTTSTMTSATSISTAASFESPSTPTTLTSLPTTTKAFLTSFTSSSSTKSSLLTSTINVSITRSSLASTVSSSVNTPTLTTSTSNSNTASSKFPSALTMTSQSTLPEALSTLTTSTSNSSSTLTVSTTTTSRSSLTSTASTGQTPIRSSTVTKIPITSEFSNSVFTDSTSSQSTTSLTASQTSTQLFSSITTLNQPQTSSAILATTSVSAAPQSTLTLLTSSSSISPLSPSTHLSTTTEYNGTVSFALKLLLFLGATRSSTVMVTTFGFAVFAFCF
ncbi:hypothetical protein L596_027438 [Steinernema carpocapsae]|uniref:Uncharacterized protein n=1 Tax=Steinernema carpocapsae TaxID=34508 RepID=A0A4U5M4B6_STECR|nr:hypothetical protein L596_027438 [Steinernema carpocapsae]